MNNFDNEELYQLSLEMLKNNDDSEITLIKTAEAFEMIGDYKDSTQCAIKCREKADSVKKEKLYESGIEKMQGMSISECEEAISIFTQILGWKDSSIRVEECKKKIKEIKLNEEKEQLELVKQLEKKKKKTRLIILSVSSFIVAAVVFLIVLATVIVPGNKYNTALELYNDGKYEEAITAFQELNGYKDSAEQINKCNDAMNDIKYNDALKMLEEEKPVEAYESLLTLGGYKDSAEKANEIYNNYASVRFDGSRAGDTVFFGTYEQDNNNSNGKEKIEWEILEKDKDKVFVISKKALDCKPFNTLDASVTWESCSLRSWLNADFYNSAFNEEEKSIIQFTNVVQESNPDFYTAAGKNTKDKIYLLSIDEINKYYSTDNAKTCVPTKYADSKGANPSSENGCCWWWLRSPGYDSHSAASVYYNGTVSAIGFYVYAEHSAIRPVMWIDISK